jgi:GNAT superfamily N-acetyltransferase
MIEYSLNRANRLNLGRVYRDVPRVDLAIDCVLEGQMGRAFVDHPKKPGAYMIRTGPLCYFAGRPDDQTRSKIAAQLEPYSIFMPSGPGWIESLKSTHGDSLLQFPRYSFSSENLSVEYLRELLDRSPHQSEIFPIDRELAAAVRAEKDHFIDLSDYISAEDFAERGIGFYLKKNGRPVACAYASLICSKGAEVSIFVMDKYRRLGVATALACRLLMTCLERNIDPHWDAANLESCRLAEKLGYVATGSYDAYFLQAPQ